MAYRLVVLALALALVPAAAVAAPGDFDNSFGNGGIVTLDWGGLASATGILVQPDGRIVPAGGGGSTASELVIGRLRPDGQPDSDFALDGSVSFSLIGGEWAEAVVRQPDGKLVAAGLTGGVTTDGLVVRVNPDGTPDASFGAGGIVTLDYGGTGDFVGDVLLQPDGKIVVAGRGGTGSNWVVTRLTPQGTPDASFDGDGTAVLDLGSEDYATAIAQQPDGKLVVSGTSGIGIWVARLNADGSPDASFDGDGRRALQPASGDRSWDALVQPDGKIVVIGESTGDQFLITRLKSNGSYDDDFATGEGLAVVSFGSSDSDQAQAVALQANGKIVVTGYTSTGPITQMAVARLHPGGDLDTTFSGDGKQTLAGPTTRGYSVALQPDGRIVVGGDDGDDTLVVRLDGDGGAAGGGPSGGGRGDGGDRGSGGVPRCAGKRATIVGSAGPNRLKGTRRTDVIVALGGNDRIAAGRGNDVICGGDGDDRIDGGHGNDRLYGQNGNDKIAGSSGKDSLSGGAGKDGLSGGSGRDRCGGGAGKDKAKCERGS